jgi:hypothetical protein
MFLQMSWDSNDRKAVRARSVIEIQGFGTPWNGSRAHKLVGEKMLAKPVRQMPYQPVSDLLLTFPRSSAVANYRRDLNLDTAITRTSYEREGVHFKREVFSSPVDRTYPNMFDAHPRFQMDGNFGGRSGLQRCCYRAMPGRLSFCLRCQRHGRMAA